MGKKKRQPSWKLQENYTKRKLEVRERRGYAQILIWDFVASACKVKKGEEDEFLPSAVTQEEVVGFQNVRKVREKI